MRRGNSVIVAALTVCVLGAASLTAQPAASAVHPYKVQGQVWLLVGGPANLAMQVGAEGVLLVDTGSAGLTDAVLAAIREVTSAPIRYVVNTSLAADRVGGNATIATLPGGNTLRRGRGPTPNLIAHENVLLRMSTPGTDKKSPYSADTWPTDGYIAAVTATPSFTFVVRTCWSPAISSPPRIFH